MTPEAWARANKKNIAREFIRKVNFTPSDTPAGVFTVGLPGAGKTEFTKELIKELVTKPLRIDMDEIASLIQGYNPKKANLFRSGAIIILEKIYDEALKASLDFVFDGTFSHPKALDNVERALSKGYTIKIYFIQQDPVVAWSFTKDRELVERRSIDRQGFIETYYKLYENIERLLKQRRNVTISVIVKDSTNHVGLRHENVDDIYRFIPKPIACLKLSRDIVD